MTRAHAAALSFCTVCGSRDVAAGSPCIVPRLPSARHRMREGAYNRALRAAVGQAAEMAEDVARFVREVLPDDAGTVHVHVGEDAAQVEVRRPEAEPAFLTIQVSVRREGEDED